MDTTDRVTEGDPLKAGEEGAASGTEQQQQQQQQKKKDWKEKLGVTKLTHWRTGVFFFSLFLCLTIVFAFSFVLPCPVRPQYLISWNRTFPDAATYDFLAVEDTSADKVLDVVFALKTTEASVNNTCDKTGLPSPCVFVMAVDGTDGKTLWELGLHPEFHWAQCGLQGDTGRSWDCLLSHSDAITAVSKRDGRVRWQRPQPAGLHTTGPVLSVPDLDGDEVGDVALVASDKTQTRLAFLSGETGVQIGSTVTLDSTETQKHLLHRSARGSYYVLLLQDSGLYGLALWRIAAQAQDGMERSLKKDEDLELKASAPSGLVPVYTSDPVRRVLRTQETNERSNLLLVTEDAVTLMDGKTLQQLWTFNASSVLSEPSFGHFNKDGVLDVVVEEDVGNHTKRIVILDGASGAALWELRLLAAPNSPRPASIHTTNFVSVFVFFGAALSETNATVPSVGDRRSYMLHPLYSEVLLESDHVVDHVVAYRATLLERGRHAAYLSLTGPATEGDDVGDTVVLSKRKLKQDVPDSRVVPAGGAGGGGGGSSETDDDIKEAFNRLRFSDE